MAERTHDHGIRAEPGWIVDDARLLAGHPLDIVRQQAGGEVDDFGVTRIDINIRDRIAQDQLHGTRRVRVADRQRIRRGHGGANSAGGKGQRAKAVQETQGGVTGGKHGDWGGRERWNRGMGQGASSGFAWTTIHHQTSSSIGLIFRQPVQQ